MQPHQRADETEFDFSKKIIKAVDKQVNKFNYTPYKKLAFFAIAIGVFSTIGVYTANNILPSFLSNTSLIQEITPTKTMTDNMNAQVAKLSSQDFDTTNQYYQTVMNMYDTKLEFINRNLSQYRLQKKFNDADVSENSLKKMADLINAHKDTITEKITKINTIKTKIDSHENVSYKDGQFLLNAVSQAKSHTFYQNSDVEQMFNIMTVATAKDIVKYLMEKNFYDKMKEIDQEIKNSLNYNPVNNTVKPKM